MKLYSVILGFGFMLLAGVSSELNKCDGKSHETTCLYYNQYGTAFSGTVCSSGGEGRNCDGPATCLPNM